MILAFRSDCRELISRFRLLFKYLFQWYTFTIIGLYTAAVCILKFCEWSNYDYTIRYDTIEEFNMDSKAEYTA